MMKVIITKITVTFNTHKVNVKLQLSQKFRSVWREGLRFNFDDNDTHKKAHKKHNTHIKD